MTNTELNTVKAKFSRYGFIYSPLTNTQIRMCIDNGLDKDTIYSIGCDVNSDYKFTSLFNEYYNAKP